jgi:DinB superfamily
MHPEQQRALDYLARRGTQAPASELLAQLQHAFRSVEELFESVGIEQRGQPPAPGKWSPHQILDHLVLSHEPAIAQLESLLAGVSPPGVAIPAGLQSPDAERKSWDELIDRMRGMHRAYVRLVASANDQLSLEPKATIEMVVKVDGQPVHWHEQADWKAFVQGVRVHTLEHRSQLERCLT